MFNTEPPHHQLDVPNVSRSRNITSSLRKREREGNSKSDLKKKNSSNKSRDIVKLKSGWRVKKYIALSKCDQARLYDWKIARFDRFDNVRAGACLFAVFMIVQLQ